MTNPDSGHFSDIEGQIDINLRYPQVLHLISLEREKEENYFVDAIIALDREIRAIMIRTGAMPSFEYMETLTQYIHDHYWHSADAIVTMMREDEGSIEMMAPELQQEPLTLGRKVNKRDENKANGQAALDFLVTRTIAIMEQDIADSQDSNHKEIRELDNLIKEKMESSEVYPSDQYFWLRSQYFTS